MDSSQRGDFSAARLIWTVVPPIIALVGIVGNITTILVFTPKQKPSSTTIYLTCVAVADLAMLVVVYPRWWLIYVFATDIRKWNDIVCRVHVFLSYTLGRMSTYTLAAVTVERIISVSMPYKSKLICTFGSACRVLGGLLVLNICLNGHVLFGFSLVDHMPNNSNNSINTSNIQNISTTTDVHAEQRTCDWTRYDNYAYYYANIHDAYVALMQTVVSVSIFVVGCVIITWKMTLSQRLRHRMKTSAGIPTDAPLAMSKKTRQITITLLLIVLVYLLCTVPVVIFLGLRHNFVVDNRMTEVQEVMWATLNQLYYFKKAVNPIIFSITGQRFRQDVEKLCGCTASQDLGMNTTSRELAVNVVAESS